MSRQQSKELEELILREFVESVNALDTDGSDYEQLKEDFGTQVLTINTAVKIALSLIQTQTQQAEKRGRTAECKNRIEILETAIRLSPKEFDYEVGKIDAWKDEITDYKERIDELEQHLSTNKQGDAE